MDTATRAELNYDVKVTKKKNPRSKLPRVPGEKANVTRRRTPGYKTRGVRVVFQTGGTGSGLNKKPTIGKKIKVGIRSFKSLQFPITDSVPIEKVLAYFETGNGKSLNALKIVEANTGKSYPVLKDKGLAIRTTF